MSEINTRTAQQKNTAEAKAGMKKHLLFLGLFLVGLGFASMTEEILGCFTLVVDGFLYLFGTTSHKAFRPILEASPYLIIAGSVILVLTLLIYSSIPKSYTFKAVRFHKFGPWKNRRAKVQGLVFLAILAHVALVNAGITDLPSICPLSFAEQASFGKYGFSALFFAGVFITVLIFGRAICSWGCVYGPVQEHCGGLLKTLGTNPNKKKFKDFGLVQILTAVFWASLVVAAFRYSESLDFAPIRGYKLGERYVFVGGLITFIPLTLLMTHFFGNRFYCKYMCPIGGTMGFYSKFALLKIHVNNETCTGCGICQEICPMGVSIDKKSVSTNLQSISDGKCIACGECVDQCPTKSLRMGFVPNPQCAPKGKAGNTTTADALGKL